MGRFHYWFALNIEKLIESLLITLLEAHVADMSSKKTKKRPHFQLEEKYKDKLPLKGGPLSGIVVIDICRAVAGPTCTKLLLDLGCRVIKCENYGSDSIRLDRPYFAQLNSGKESVKIDFKDC